MGDLRWSLGALSRHQSGDGSQAADDERKPGGCTNDQYMRDMMGMHSPRGVASCRGHRGALPPCHETALHLRHGVLMSQADMK